MNQTQHKKGYKYRRTIMFLSRTFLFVCIILEFVLIWQNAYEETVFFRKGNYVVTLVYAVLFFVFNAMYGGFRIGRYRRNEIIYSNSLSLVIANMLMYFQLSLMASELLPAGPVVVQTLLQIATVVVLVVVINKVYFMIYPIRSVVLLCRDAQEAQRMEGKISRIRERYHVAATLTQEQIGKGCLKKIEETIGCVMIGSIDLNLRRQVSDYCYDHDIRMYVIPSVEDVLLNSAELTQIFDTPVLLSKDYHLTQEQKIVKRLMDILFSAVGLLIASPFMLLTALAIVLYDRHSPIYRQVRVTQDNREFYLYKFRSMVVDAEKGGQARLASKGDPRITPVGRVIRATRLDELPQLLNILKGDMSLVGPRPERPQIIAEYVKKYPEFRYRTKMKAGLTGYAQVMGKYNTSPQDKLLLDLVYIEKYSLRLDIKLLFLTFKIMFMKDSTEGIEEGQLTADSSAQPQPEDARKDL